MESERLLLLKWIEEGYSTKAWHGPNLRGAIRRSDERQASWRLAPQRRNIAEIVVHCAYWKYTLRRRLRGDKRGSFALRGSNWFPIPERLTKEQWRRFVRLLDTEHDALVQTIMNASWRDLCRTKQGLGDHIPSRVYGLAMHDVYHAGQIQTIKALYKSRG
ncbi:MAG: DinB family protein [Planctomycetes bacterium]|nr:DinB family protein [Planctomycetota bacterium]MBI3833575.1 DinB family protein [Planctomycetota bacterium]